MTKRKMRIFRILLLCMLFVLACGMTAQAKTRKGWVRKKNKCYYYENGNRVKGLKKIGSHTYYFDSKGIQRTSWRKINNEYYCFRSEERAGGYMLTNTTKNGIRIEKDGKATLSSDRDRKKAAIMVRISNFTDKILARSKKRLSSRHSRLRVCYNYLRRKIPYRFVSHFRGKDPNYDLWYVNALLTRGYADCHPYACTFAYIANALGYKDVYVYSWHGVIKKRRVGHSYTMIGSRIYDVSLGRHAKKSYALFGIKPKKYYKKYPRYRTKTRRKI